MDIQLTPNPTVKGYIFTPLSDAFRRPPSVVLEVHEAHASAQSDPTVFLDFESLSAFRSFTTELAALCDKFEETCISYAWPSEAQQ